MLKARLLRVAAGLAALFVAVSLFPMMSSQASTTTLTIRFRPKADGFVSSWSPTTNYGRARTLALRSSSPTRFAYLHFDVSVPDPIYQATLLVYSYGSTTRGIGVSTATNRWSETHLTYRNRPVSGRALARSAKLTKRRWVAIDVTPFIHANGSYSLMLRAMSAESVTLTSREGGATSPVLRIKTHHTTITTPSPTPTLPLPSTSPLPTISPTPTISPSIIPTPSQTPTGPAVITDPFAIFTQPQVGKPGYMSSFTDPVFGTTIERIAGNAGSGISFSNGSTGTWGSDARQHYNDDQAWNADGSLLWIENSSGGTPSRVILDGNTYQPVMKPCSNYSYYDDRWSPTLPHVRVFRNGSTVGWFDITTCTLLRSWTLPIQTTIDSEAGPSRDGSMWAQGDASTGKILAIRMDPMPGLVGPAYDAQTNCGLTDCTIDHVAISPSGHYILVHYVGDHDRIFDVNPTTLALTPHVYPAGTPECSGRNPSIGSIFDLGHSDLTFDANGDDIAVGQNRSWCPQTVGGVSLGQIYSVRLKDGKVTSLIHTNTAQAYHVSCRDFDRPGWCYAWFWPGSGEAFSNEVIAVKTDGSGQVERLANVHTDTNGCYRCESHPVPSRDGMRVLFASSWSVDCGSTCGTQSNPQVYVIDTRSLTRS